MVLTTTKWNALNSGGISFQVNVVAQEETWVTNPNAPAVIYIDASCFTYEENNDEITITGYDYETCGTDVSIPPTINNKSVTPIGYDAFAGNQLTSVTIGNGVRTIGEVAFQYNQLTSVIIPNSVTTIRRSAFESNQLTSVTIGNGITSIREGAFTKDPTSNPNLASITIDKTCTAIKALTCYPWLDQSLYTGSYSSGTTIYGSGNEVCDAY